MWSSWELPRRSVINSPVPRRIGEGFGGMGGVIEVSGVEDTGGMGGRGSLDIQVNTA